MKNFLIVSHKFLTQPDDDLVLYLNKSGEENVMHVTHSFSDSDDRRSRFVWSKKGKMHKEGSSPNFDLFRFFEPFIFFKEFVYTLSKAFSLRSGWDLYIGMDGLCTIFGLFLREIGLVDKVVFWVIDVVPSGRFGIGWKEAIYRWINTISYRSSDEVWDLSPKMAEAREKFYGLSEGDYKKRRVVPHGVWVERMSRYSFDECEKNTLVFMGHLLEKQGVQLVIRALPQLIKDNKEFKFKIIGGGNYKSSLESLAEELGVSQHCIFMGKIDRHEDLEKEIAVSAVAIAPYVKNLDTWTLYADPGKIKVYLACGVPVLTTSLPWNSAEIAKERCGLIIEEDPADIRDKVLRLMEKGLNAEYRENAAHYAENFDYNKIFGELNL